MNKVGVCGYYAKNLIDHGGQPVKTINVTTALKKKFGNSQVNCVDTTNWKKRKTKLFFECLSLIRNSENVIILPASKGLLIFVPLFAFLNLFFRRKIHYILIGGWLVEVLNHKKYLIGMLKRFNTIFVETHILINQLKDIGLKNVQYLPNFKNLKLANPLLIKYTTKSVLRFCTFSRVVEGKGIKEAIEAIKILNQDKTTIKYTLDIYGEIHCDYQKDFDGLLNTNSKFVFYKGSVKPDESVNTIKEYFMLLFPTKFYTEGVPGTIIDSFYAGVPVIASKWESFSDLISDGVNGIGYEFGNFDDFVNKIKWSSTNVDVINSMKNKCQLKAREFSYENAVNLMIKKF